MGYLEKYYHSYCAPNGAICRISILEKDYVGASTEIDGQEVPILINYESTEDFKFSPIRASSAEVLMVFDTRLGVDFEEFWTADERQFQVKHLISGVIDWIGFVIPNGFSYELRGGKYYASIQCSDGLSTLQSINFWNENTLKPYGTEDLTYNNGFEFPFILVLTEILRKLDLEINVWACIDSYEKTMTKTGDTRNADPLATAYVNVKTYIDDTDRKELPYWRDDSKVWNSEEVLINLCYLFGAKVYQQGGVWRIKSINADVDYGSGATQRYWRKYNTLAVYLGYETINSLKVIGCDDMIDNDHTMYMGDVYKAFRMNYEYQFVRDGDSPIQLLTNGNFATFDNVLKYSAPLGWERIPFSTYPMAKLRGVTVNEEGVPFSQGIEFGLQKAGLEDTTYDQMATYGNGLRHQNIINVNKGDKLFFEVWNKHKPARDDNKIYFFVLYKVILKQTDGTLLYLGNKFTAENGQADYQWSETECFWTFNSAMMVGYDAYEMFVYKWRNYKIELQIPENAELAFHIKGLTASTGAWDNGHYKPLITYMGGANNTMVLSRDQGKVIRGGWLDQGGYIPRLIVGGVSLAKIPNESDLATLQDFIYTNTNTNYSLVPDPITVYNGDLQDQFHISNIIVPTNVSGGKNFWDTIDNKFGNSSLGLLTVRTIMSQYFKPFRILEGKIKGDSFNFGDVFTFDILPDLRFILQRGAFNRKKGYIENATFMQLLTDTLPTGGTESGNNTDPDWQPTGITRCRKSGFLNDGWIEYQVSDVNQNSESYGQFDWFSGTLDLEGACPLGEPDAFYWGADVINSTYVGFNTYPVIWDEVDYPNTAIVEFDNVGGLYLYFIHLDALGVVEEVTTAVQSNIISDWQYLTDVTFNGYLYRVLRMNYPTADFTDLMVRFKFN